MKSYIKGSVYLAILLVVAAGFTLAYVFTKTAPEFLSGLRGSSQVAAVAGAIGQTYEVRTVAELLAARTAIRALPRDSSWRGATIALHGGYYNLSSTLALDAGDSGTSAYPIIYMTYPGEQAVISGAKAISPSWFSKVSSATPKYSSIQSGVRGNVYVADLKANGITDYGVLQKMGYGSNLVGETGFDRTPNSAMELIMNDKVMMLARWPNEGVNEPDNAAKDNAINGWVRIASVNPSRQPGFQLPGTRWQNWTSNTDMRWLGLYYNTWTDNTLGGRVDSSGYVTLSETTAVGGVPEPNDYAGSGKLYAPVVALNALQELDIPGEYYLDRTNGLLYFYPPSSLSGASISGTILEGKVITLINTSYVTFSGVIVEGGRNDLVRTAGSTHHITFEDMIFRNGGNDAIVLDPASNITITRSIFHGFGGAAIAMANIGSRAGLSSGNVSITNNEFYDLMRLIRTGASAGAIVMAYYGQNGVRIANNYFHDIRNMAVSFQGNDIIVEYNRFKNMNYEYPDSGIVYSYADWAEHGTIIRYNIFENSVYAYPHFGIKYAGANVYLDGAASGVNTYGNIMYNSQSLGVLVNSGHDNKITGNVIVGSSGCVAMNGSTVNNANHYKGLHDDIKALGYQGSTWASRFPTLAAIPSDWAQVNGSKWFGPEGSMYEKNICTGYGYSAEWGNQDIGGSGPKWGTGGNIGDSYHSSVNNPSSATKPNYDPKFVNPGAGNFNFQSSSPVFTISGFGSIPVSQIGILDPRRASGTAPPPTTPPPVTPPPATPPPADTTAPTISSVSSSGVSQTGAAISWVTNESADTQVEYGLTTSYGSNTALNSTMSASHNVTLSGLTANTVYHYRVKSRDAAGNLATSADFTFTTLATSGTTPPPTPTATPAPLPTMTAPAFGATYVKGIPVFMSATLSGDTSNLSKVDFYQAGVPLGTDTTAPYSLTYTFTTAGTYSISARAENQNGLGQSSQGVTITVTEPVTTPTTPTTPPTPSGSSALETGLVGWWKLDETSGNSAADSSGNGRNATLSGAPSRIDGRAGKGLAFDSVDDEMTVASYANLSPGLGDFSVAGWIKTTTKSDVIQTSDGNGISFVYGFGLVTNWCSGGRLYFNMANGTERDRSFCSNASVTDGSWHHYVVSVKRGTAVSFFIDGQTDATIATTMTGPVTYKQFNLGQASWFNAFAGQMDDIRFYNRTLTASEALALYQYTGDAAPTTPPPPATPTTPPPPPPPPDADGDGITDAADKCQNTSVSLRSVVNELGCPKPLVASFDTKPNFANQDLTGMATVELGRNGLGKVTWNVPVKLVSGTDGQLNLDQAVTFIQNKVTVDTSIAPDLNKPATVTLYNVTAANPKILKNGVDCTTCQTISFSGGTLVFGVTSFSTYEVVNIPATTPTTPAPTPIAGSCGTTQNQCTSGTLSDQPDSNTSYIWQCVGSGGGITMACSTAKPVSQTPSTPVETTPNTGGVVSSTSYVDGGRPLTGGAAPYSGGLLTSNTTINNIIYASTTNPTATSTVVVKPSTCPTGTVCTPTQTGAVTSATFTRNLELGVTGSDVQALQKYLNSQGFTVSVSGAGSPGNETQTFGPATKAALARFQASKGLPATGYFGPMTRTLLAGSTTIKPTTPIALVTPVTPVTPVVVTGAKLTRTIYQGSIGEDIRTLQKILNAKGYTVSTTGAGSPGNETTFFGGKTTAAVERLQCATLQICSGSVGTTGYGLVGARTRGILNK